MSNFVANNQCVMRTFALVLFLTCSISAFGQENLYAWDTIQDIRIYFKQDNWQRILNHYKKLGNKDRLTADVSIGGVNYEGVGVRYKGNSSYNNAHNEDESKLPFNIKLDYENNDLETPEGFDKIKLANLFRDPSYTREILAYEIARKYMPAPKCNFASVYINDKHWGLYSNVESIDKHFLKIYYGEKNGTLFKCDPESWNIETRAGCQEGGRATLNFLGSDIKCYENYYELKSDNIEGWDDLLFLANTLEQENIELDSVLDIGQTLWMLAFNNVIVNLDSYTGLLCHNYYLYKTTDGRFHPLVWDMNLAFGGFRMSGEGGAMTNEEMQSMSPFLHYKNTKRPLINKLLSNDLNRKIYLAKVKTILEENFQSGWYKERIQEIQALIDTAVQKDSNKLYTYEQFKANVDSTSKAGSTEIIGITELMEARVEYLNQHPLLKKKYPTIEDVRHKLVADSLVNVNVSAEEATQVWLFHRAATSSIFRKTLMTKQKDEQWNIQLSYQPNLQYYIVAEGAETASLLPKRAGMQYFTVLEKKADSTPKSAMNK